MPPSESPDYSDEMPEAAPLEAGALRYVSVSTACEFWEVECENGTVTITVNDGGVIVDAAIWRDGKAEQLDIDKARPILEAAIAHHDRDDEPSDDPGELKEQQDFAQDDLPEPMNANDDE